MKKLIVCCALFLSAPLLFEAEAIADQALRPGVLAMTVVPASTRPADKRLEIEINNLINNAYFRIGNDNPPEGWNSYGGESYQPGIGDGRAIRLQGNDNPKQDTLALRQNGIILIPGEKYRLSGYIRGQGFTGKMEGHIGIACDNWSKIRGYFYTEKDIRPDWQYFEVEFTPAPSKAGEYETIIYRNNSGGGYIEVSRLILEPLSEAAIKGSSNKYQNDKFSENYAKALKAGNFRSGPPTSDYKLVWHDEFDGPTIDDTKWHIYDLYKDKNPRPNYLSPQNLSFDGQGHLCLTTRKEPDGRISQPRISSTTRQAWVYGFFEARIQFHDSDLVNAAFWMLPEGQMNAYDPVNKGEEIDIMECITPSRNTLSHTTHWWHTDPQTKQHVSFSGGTRARTVPGLNQGWHTIALEWTPTDMFFYIDGIESWHVNSKNHPITKMKENIIFSFGARVKEVQELPAFSTTYKVDYVRVYQKDWQ